MNTLDINKILKDTTNFYGTVCRDELPRIKKRPISIIANTDPCSKPGQHWIVILLNEKGRGNYFDSFGLPPLHQDFIIYMDINCPNGWSFNHRTLQSVDSDTCGLYCILYIKLGKKKFNKIFGKDVKVNDFIAKSIVKDYKKNMVI